MSISVGIFSWNIGKNCSKDSIVNDFINKIKQTYDEMPTVLVIGFQELTTRYDLKDLKDVLLDNLKIYSLISSDNACTTTTNFQIKTFVFIKKSNYCKDIVCKTISPSGIKSNSVCLNSKGQQTNLLPGTKGYVLIQLTMNNSTFNFVNTHFPLKNEIVLKTFYKNIQKFIDSNLKHTENEYVFVFGDINSRSTLDGAYAKSVDNCKISNNSNLCNTKKYLESLPFEQTYNFSNKPQNDLNDLVTTDYIGNPPDKIFKGYNEAPITFLPTYKRDTVTGLFKLEKGNEGRLAGYADRIFFTSGITCIAYGSLGVKGNDHLPIGGHFETNNLNFGKRNGKKIKHNPLKSLLSDIKYLLN